MRGRAVNGALDRPGEGMYEELSRVNNELATLQRRLSLRNAELAQSTQELQEQVEQRTRHLKESNDELEMLAYAMAHDLRAPARQLDALAGLLHESCAAKLLPHELEWLRLGRETAARQCILVERILEHLRLGSAPLSFERIDMEAEAASAISAARANWPEANVQWSLDRLPAARADRALVREILRQLLDNAVKFTSRSAAPRVWIEASQHDGAAVFRVRDNGVGLDGANADLLFKPLQRLHGPADFPGIGMGLATVRRLVARHDGRVWVETGGGAAFHFTLGPGDG